MNENEHNKILKEYQDWELGRIALIESMMIHYLGWREVIEEIAKCELVCGNCHRKRTNKRLREV